MPVCDYGEADDQPHIVMRFMPGGSLADRMAQAPLSHPKIARLFQRLAAALDAAHQRNIVHRPIGLTVAHIIRAAPEMAAVRHRPRRD